MVNLRAPLLAALPAAAAQNSTLWNAQSAPSDPSPWGQGLGDWADAYASARKFVSGLTLVEKVNLTTGVGWQGELCVGNTGSIPRVGFKSLCNEDSPLGVRDTDFNSAFAAGVTIAATWDRALLRQRGYDMATEHKLKGVDTQLGPVVGPLGRAPEGGRNWEGFAPDPVLSGIAVAETIKGMQQAGVMACTKHYILNEQEHFRQGAPPAYLKAAISSNIDDVAMHELYLWPFADAVRAGTASIMCSYNQVNNSYACQNSHNLNYLLKNELGFQGFVMSDWSAQHSGVSSALAGLDMTMPGDIGFNTGTSYWGTNLTIAVLNGTVPQWRLDDMAVRIMAAWYYVDREANQVENAPNFSAWTLDTEGWQHNHVQEGYGIVNHHVNVQGNHGQHIREAGAKGTVLLKNTGGLPLTGNEQLTAIFGEDATQNAYGANGCGDRACDNGTLAMGWGSGTANFPYLITPAEAIRSEVLGRSNGVSVEAVVDDYAYDQIIALANRVGNAGGVCLVFANSDSGEGYLTVDGNEGDRNNLTLWHNANEMIANVTSYCNNTVVVMHTVGAVLVDSFYQNPNVTAIVWAGIPGQESGNSIVDVLYGKVNPGGKTPFTWGPSRESYGTDVMYVPNNGVNAPQQNFDEGIFIDYRGFDKHNITPIYEFGFGLSYTSFSFSNLNVQAHSVPAYESTTGMTSAAPTYGTINKDPAEYVFPEGHNRVYEYIYPWLNSTSLSESSGDPLYGEEYQWPEGSSDGSAQPYLAAGSAKTPGGNAALYDIMFTVTAKVTNTGKVQGDEVPQMYISLGGPNDAKVVLRNFDRITIDPGKSATFKADITRRDLSNWDTAAQDWLISSYPKTVYVGNSSRNLPLRASLNMSGGSSGYPTGSGSGSSGPAYGNPAGGPASGGAATQIGDGQVQAPGVATQIGDGQVQAPGVATQIGDGQVQAPSPAPGVATQIGDGQVQAPGVATQIGDGQVQAPSPVPASY